MTSPQQKKLFIRAYKIASEKAFTKDNIRAGFRGAGIYPTDIDKVLPGLRPKKRSREQDSRPTTPMREPVIGPELYNTPRSSRDIEKTIGRLEQSGQPLTRDQRDAFHKCGKEIDENHTKMAHSVRKEAILKAQVAAKQPSKRKKVQFDPNAAFHSISSIITARDEANKTKPVPPPAPKPRKKRGPPKKKKYKEGTFFDQFVFN